MLYEPLRSFMCCCFFLEMVHAQQSTRLCRGLMSFFAPFSSCYVLHFYGRNQNPIDGSDSRECMILSLSTLTHSTSKLTTLSQGLHPSCHRHPDNIGIMLWLCNLHSRNVLSTLGSYLDSLGLIFLCI